MFNVENVEEKRGPSVCDEIIVLSRVGKLGLGVKEEIRIGREARMKESTYVYFSQLRENV